MAERTLLFSRDELLGGLPARRASTLLFAIESRVAHLVVRSREAMARYLTDRTADERHAAFLEAVSQGRTLPVEVSVQDLERYAPAWAPLVPDEPALRVELARLIGAKYRLVAGRVPGITAALGLDEPAVVAAFAQRSGADLASILPARLSIGERWRWWRASAAYRLEHLPPFWMAFALTLTETIGEGVLTVPIAVAGLGPLAGLAVLVVLGVVNLVTIGAIVEAINRDGDMRYGSSYFGHLVRNYLGSAGTALLTPAMLALDIVCLLTYGIGFATAVGGATGTPPELWAAALLAANLIVLARDSMNATVASAIAVGAVNVALILGICLVAAPLVSTARLASGPSGPGGAPFALGDLGIVLGVVLVAYFGHTSTGSAAKVVLRQDPTGRSLLRGNLAAMAMVIALYSLVTVVVLGVVPARELVGYGGTPLTPLAAIAGPVINVLGSLYATIAIGFGSLYVSLSLFNQVREWLPTGTARGDAAATGVRRFATGRRSRVAIALAPVIAVFGLVEVLFVTGQESFTAPLGFLGLLSCALVGGVFPMLMVSVSRRRGDIVPGAVVRAIGHPVVVTLVTTVYIGAILLHGLFIWTSPVERGLAALTAGAALALIVRSVRTGAFRPTAVVEVRIDEASSDRGRLEVSSAGAPITVPVQVTTDDGTTAVEVSGLDLGRARTLRALAIALPREGPRELRVWVHRTTLEGDSLGWPALVIVEDASSPRVVAIDGATGWGSTTLDDGKLTLRVEPGRRGLAEVRP